MSVRLRLVVFACVFVAAVAAARPAAAPVPATVSVTGGAIGLATGLTSPAFTVSLSQPVTGDLQIQLVLTGEGFPGSSVSPSTLTFGPGDTTRTFTLTAGHNLGQLEINYLLSGTDAPAYAAPAPNIVAIKSPLSYWGLAPEVFTGDVRNASVGVGQVPIQGNLNVSFSLSGSAAAGSSISPSTATITDFNGSVPFTLTIGPNEGALTLEVSLSGSAEPKYAAPAPFTLTVTKEVPGQAYLISPPAEIGIGGMAALHLTLPSPVRTGLTVTPSLSGSGAAGAVSLPSSVTFSAGQMQATFNVAAVQAGDITVSFGFSGPDASRYIAPSPHTYVSRGHMTLAQQAPVLIGSTSAAHTLTLSQPAMAPLTVSLSGSGVASGGVSYSPSLLSFAPGESSKTFTITGGSTIGSLVTTFTPGAEAGAYFYPLTIEQIVRAPITVNAPAFIAREATSDPITVTLGAPAPAPTTLNIVKFGTAAATLSTSALTFNTGETSKTFTLTTGAGSGDLFLSFQAVGEGAWAYIDGATTKIVVQSRITITTGGDSINRNGTRGITVQLFRVPQSTVTVTLSLGGEGAAGASLSQTVLEFGAFQSSKTVIVTAGPNVGPLVISGVSSGAEAAYYSAPEPLNLRVVAPIAPNGPPPVINENATWTLSLPIPAPAAFTASLSLINVTSPGTQLSVGSVTFAAGETGPKTFQITGGTTIGTATLVTSLSGDGATFFVAANRPITITARSTLSGHPAAMPVSTQSDVITLTLPVPAPAAFTATVNLGGSAASGSFVTTSPLSFAAGDTSKTFRVTTGPNTGALSISFSASGAGAAFFRFPFASIAVGGVATPAGTNVSVDVPPASGVSTSVDVTFGEVTAAGTTRMIAVPAASQAPPPSGFEIPGSPLYFALNTTAAVSGPVTVCASYPDGAAIDETGLRLFARSGSQWVDVTVTVDTAGNEICGQLATLASTFTTLAVFRLNAPPSVAVIPEPSLVMAGENSTFTATVTDPDAADVHTGTWIWGDGTTSPATIVTADGVRTATGTHAFTAAGRYAVALVVSDGGQQARSNDHEVRVDAAAPVISALSASPERIWPPDNKLHSVTLAIEATDDSGVPPVCEITKIEAAGDRAPGLGAGEYAITGPLTASLQATMFRVYTITVTCTDVVGRTTTATVSVAVSRDM